MPENLAPNKLARRAWAVLASGKNYRSPDDYDLRLDPEMRKNVAALCDVLKPHDALQMRSYPVSSRINHER